MLFCLSLCDETGRVILDRKPHGKVLAKFKGRYWQHARRRAEGHRALDVFLYRNGYGWERRQTSLYPFGKLYQVKPAPPIVRITGYGLEVVMRDLLPVAIEHGEQLLAVQAGAVNEFAERGERNGCGFGHGFVRDALVVVTNVNSVGHFEFSIFAG